MPDHPAHDFGRAVDANPDDPLELDVQIWRWAGNVVVGMPKIEPDRVSVMTDSYPGAVVVDELLRTTSAFAGTEAAIVPKGRGLYEVSRARCVGGQL